MSKSKKLSLLETIFITTNIMLGTGTFVNTAMLAKTVGSLGGFLYGVVGLLMLPLSFCFARLTRVTEGGSFYDFGIILGKYWGFISTWSYFIGKLASASLSMHVFIRFIQSIIPFLSTVPTLWLDYLLIGLFISLNLLDVKTGGKIQYLFLSAKILPLLVVIISSLHYLQVITIAPASMIWDGIPIALPLMLFCFLGFEATCSLTHIVDNPQKNIPRAIIISFIGVLTCIMIYQTLFYMSMGSELSQIQSYVDLFPLLFSKTIPSYTTVLSPIFSIIIGIAALGGAYGILYSNSWNLFTLAEHATFPYASLFLQRNRYAIPYLCVIAEGLLCCGYLAWLKGAQIPLQYTATLACAVTYTLSALALFKIERSLLAFFGIITCCVVTFFCIQGFIHTNIMPLIVLGTILALGTITYYATSLSTQFKRH